MSEDHTVEITFPCLELRELQMVLHFLDHHLYQAKPVVSLGNKCIIVEFIKFGRWNKNLTAIFDALKTIGDELEWKLIP